MEPMSQPTAGSVMPDPQTAYDNLTHGVHAEVFFAKCAAAGLAPQTPEDAVTMLRTAHQIRGYRTQKQAADRGVSPFQQIKAAADRLTGGGRPAYVEEEVAMKAAADQFANDPTLYNSVLSLAGAEADAIRTQLASH
jgi:hypothetical protein